MRKGRYVASGSVKWSTQTGASLSYSPAVVNGLVYYIGSDDGSLYALDAATGTKKWSYQAGEGC